MLFRSNYVLSLALQADGKILVGGLFTTLGGTNRNYIARLNADGTLEPSFDPVAYFGSVNTLALQPDGKILVGNYYGILRLNVDGTVDPSFNADADSYVDSLALQADGKILVGGGFNYLCGQWRNHIARLGVDGTLDPNFSGKPQRSVA